MPQFETRSRRAFIRSALAGGAGFLASAWPSRSMAAEEQEAPVFPTEDLMREHGVLDRVLLIYEESLRRLGSRQTLDPTLLASAAGIIHDFIERYHEKLEEDYLFTRLEKAGQLVALVQVLRTQHKAGRRLTTQIRTLSTAAGLENPGDRTRLVMAMRQFIRMYRPHEAREDTVLFPAFHRLVPPKEFAELGEKFEDIEHQRFGPAGFEGVVAHVAELEKALGIYDLAPFTPR